MENFAYTYWNWNKEMEQCAAPIASADSAKTTESDRDSASRPNTWLNLPISDDASLEFDAQSCPTYFLM
ncbi:MAG: hypothetical protein DCF22_03440 [Leptolyngbya sp.]|nr:MAG: hypothetical protein DCF22_03440 [Leptolyngbya sp.]